MRMTLKYIKMNLSKVYRLRRSSPRLPVRCGELRRTVCNAGKR